MKKEIEKKEFQPYFTIGLVLRCNLNDLNKVKKFLDSTDTEVLYQTMVSGDKKLIIKEVNKK